AQYEQQPLDPLPYQRGGFDEPHDFEPRPYEPGPYESGPYESGAYDPAAYDPGAYEPGQFEDPDGFRPRPSPDEPGWYEPRQFDPRLYGPDQRGEPTPGPAQHELPDVGPPRSGRIPSLEGGGRRIGRRAHGPVRLRPRPPGVRT